MQSYNLQLFKLRTTPQQYNNFTFDCETDNIASITFQNGNGAGGTQLNLQYAGEYQIVLFNDQKYTFRANKNERLRGVINVKCYGSANPLIKPQGIVYIIVKRYT